MMLVAAAAAAVLVALQLSAAAASATAPAAATDQCDTWCGDVEVPYPFSITPGCSYPAPGFNLTCDRTSRPPRLLLGDGTFRVVGIFPTNSTMLVHRTGAVNMSRGRGEWPAGGGLRDDGPIILATSGNELVVTGCNVVATLRGANDSFISGCSSFCPRAGLSVGPKRRLEGG